MAAQPVFSKAATFVAILLLFCALIHFTTFQIKTKSESLVRRSSQNLDEERIPFLRHGSIVTLNWRDALIHALWDNKISSALIIISLVNSCSFHISLVLTTIYFSNDENASQENAFKLMISQANMFASLGCLITISYFSRISRSPKFYSAYMYIAIAISAICNFIMPFFKEILTWIPYNPKFVIWTFIVLKESACYYLYSSILSYLISVSIYKLFRKPLNFALGMVKSMLNAAIFNLILPILYWGPEESWLDGLQTYKFVFCFGIIALSQIATLFKFKYIRFVLKESNMID